MGSLVRDQREKSMESHSVTVVSGWEDERVQDLEEGGGTVKLVWTPNP